MDSKHILPLLGLALRGGNLSVGEEPVEAAARAKDARLLLLASDAAANTRRRVIHFAEMGHCLWLVLPFTKAELGQAAGRTSAAVVAVTDIGLANAVARRLVELDPVQYGEAAERLEIKAKRAAERKAEQRAHEKNIRTGKRKPKKAEPQKTASSHTLSAEPEKKRSSRSSRPSKGNRPKWRANPYAHSRPVKKGKGSFRQKKG